MECQIVCTGVQANDAVGIEVLAAVDPLSAAGVCQVDVHQCLFRQSSWQASDEDLKRSRHFSGIAVESSHHFLESSRQLKVDQ